MNENRIFTIYLHVQSSVACAIRSRIEEGVPIGIPSVLQIGMQLT